MRCSCRPQASHSCIPSDLRCWSSTAAKVGTGRRGLGRRGYVHGCVSIYILGFSLTCLACRSYVYWPFLLRRKGKGGKGKHRRKEVKKVHGLKIAAPSLET